MLLLCFSKYEWRVSWPRFDSDGISKLLTSGSGRTISICGVSQLFPGSQRSPHLSNAMNNLKSAGIAVELRVGVSAGHANTIRLLSHRKSFLHFTCLFPLKRSWKKVCVCKKGDHCGKTTPERCHSTLQSVIFITFLPSRAHLVWKAAIKCSIYWLMTAEKCQSRIKGIEVFSAQHSIAFEERIIKSPAITKRISVGMSSCSSLSPGFSGTTQLWYSESVPPVCWSVSCTHGSHKFVD